LPGLKINVDYLDNSWYNVIMKLENASSTVVGKYVQTFLGLDDYERARSRALRDGVSLQDFLSTAIIDYLERRNEKLLDDCFALKDSVGDPNFVQEENENG
jgi:hypothetical protein